MTHRAYAAAKGDEVLIKTVFPSARGAMVNTIMSEWSTPVYACTPDAAIEKYFDHWGKRKGIRLVEIEITIVGDAK